MAITSMGLLGFKNIKNEDLSVESASTPFLLTEDFEPSTYYISPYTSPGANDGVFFSFTPNRNGNFTLKIENFPNFITDSSIAEGFLSFDNPSGTNLWYIAYVESDKENFGDFNIKVSRTEDFGKHWHVSTIATYQSQTIDVFKRISYIKGSAVAANPSSGVIGVVTWVNWTDLVFIGSVDNGTTWNTPVKISNSTALDCSSRFDIDENPRIEIGILKNGSIFVISEISQDSHRNIAYMESVDNGNSWSTPSNITIANGIQSLKPKLQVDRNSGKYWLMWHTDEGGQYLRWAEFQPTESLSVNVGSKYVGGIIENNFDFYYDGSANVFRMFHITSVVMEIWNTTSYNTAWTNTPIDYVEELSSLNSLGDNFGLAYDGQTIQLFFTESFSGNTDIYQYTYFPSPTFWTRIGNFRKEQMTQIFWNGRMMGGIPIPISRVLVEFTAQNGSSPLIEKRLYLTIDNQKPSFDDFTQQRNFFNPLSSNITISDLPWDILASEPCTAYLEIFRDNIELSSWKQITNNNWQDSEPQIFISNKGVIYILYKTLESGRNILYLIKSLDHGITWTTPVKILESNQFLRYYHGASWGDLVTVYVKDQTQHLLYRSFDSGETFQPPLLLSNQPEISSKNFNIISRILFTDNGTMFLTFVEESPSRSFFVLRSDNIGLNWSSSGSWVAPPAALFDSFWNPDIIFDRMNRLLHVVMPFGNFTELNNNYRYSNYSFVTMNFTTNQWGEVKSPGIFQTGIQFFKFFGPKFMITQDGPLSPLTIRAIFINDLGGQTGVDPIYYEINSTDFGNTWSKPYQIPSLNFSAFTSEIIETYYVQQLSDGYDDELYIRREGRLVRSIQGSISSTQTTELSFDGIDDFNEYLVGGNYSYKLRLRDSAGNQEGQEGWMFIDYNAPQVGNPELNWSQPTPRLDIEVSTIISDETDFSAYLHYKKDTGAWQSLQMTDTGTGNYTALIPGDEDTERIIYFIRAVDLAGNMYIQNDNGANYLYEMPRYIFTIINLFNETFSYSSSQDYDLSINISHYEYIETIVFRYSLDNGLNWIDLELVSNSPVFTGTLEDIPEDTRTFLYQLVLTDIYGEQTVLMDTQQVEFFPEIPSLSISGSGSIIIVILAAVVGFLVAFGYIKLKGKSHEVIYKQIFLREYTKKSMKIDDSTDKAKKKRLSIGKKKEVSDENGILLNKSAGASPFTIAYLGILAVTLTVFFIGYILADLNPQGGILLLAASLVLSIFGYMILISRDISLNIYLEKIFKRNILLEFFQIGFMLFNIIMILFRGYEIPWFRYYLIEQTYDLGTVSIPKLYISVFGVFFTSLVLVMITTYLQLRKTVKNVRGQRTQGASDNLLLYIKDQNSSRLITQMGYKTIAFLVTVLVGIVSTTNLLTAETGMALLVVIIPFIIAGFSALVVQRLLERKKHKEEAEEIELPFIDSKKVCNKCGESIYLSNKYCGSCGNQVVFEENVGIYTLKCPVCDGYIVDKADFCPTCGTEVKKLK
ncbi:MAG: double zinc ribbon domain-containing protein [Promethearchaeota archaeon]|jgi:hypothetical protein